MMLDKKRKWKRLGENIGGHVRCRDPVSTKSTVGNVIADKVMSNVNVFRSGGDSRVVGKRTSALVIGE